TDLGVREARGLLLNHQDLDILTQRSLVAFQRENVIRFLVEDLLRDVTLAPHGIDGHDGPLDRQRRCCTDQGLVTWVRLGWEAFPVLIRNPPCRSRPTLRVATTSRSRSAK